MLQPMNTKTGEPGILTREIGPSISRGKPQMARDSERETGRRLNRKFRKNNADGGE